MLILVVLLMLIHYIQISILHTYNLSTLIDISYDVKGVAYYCILCNNTK